LEGPYTWTENPNQALDFKFVDRALRYAEIWELAQVEVAFFWDGSAEVSGLPLTQAAVRCRVAARI
jgi:hypothetical protein